MPVRGRMLSASLATSRKFARLESNDHRLMYVMLLPQVDCEGRHDAEATILAGKCYTSLGFTPDQIMVGLGDMANVGLIRLYEAHGDLFLEVVDFHVHQTIRRKKDGTPQFEASSRIPAPPERGTTGGPQGSSGTPSEGTQENHGGTTEAPPLHNADQSKAKQSKGETLTGSLPPVDTQTVHRGTTEASGAPRPKGRGPAPAVAEYEARRAPREKTPAELELERFAQRAEA